MIFKGHWSTFGGPSDSGMLPRPGMPAGDSGIAFYENNELNKRPDIALPCPSNEPDILSWKRLRPDFPYLALNVPILYPGLTGPVASRIAWRNMPWRITSAITGQSVTGFLVDRGPGVPGRVADLSYCIPPLLRLANDDLVIVENLLPLHPETL